MECSDLFMLCWCGSGFIFWVVIVAIEKYRDPGMKIRGNEYTGALLFYSLAFGPAMYAFLIFMAYDYLRGSR